MITDTNPHPAGSDEYWMYRALQLARRGLGQVSPNPLVGCVLVRDGNLIGEGWHASYGGPHAEVAALAAAGDSRGAVAYVSLEPCSHHGRQPRSCTTALVEAGVSRVLFAFDDPDPRSHGQASGLLRAAGIEVQSGLLADEARLQLDYFIHNKERQSCFTCLKLASSLDGRIACANGHSQWLSGRRSHGYAHFLRQKHDAILVGSGTVRADNPKLTTRRDVLAEYLADMESVQLRHPTRVLLDPRFELLTDLDRYAVSDLSGEFREGRPRLIVAGLQQHAPSGWQGSAELLPLIGMSGRIDFHELAAELWQRGTFSLLVEGGASVAASLLGQGALQQLALVHTPVLLGADAMSFAPSFALQSVDDAQRFHLLDSARLDDDVLMLLEPRS
ncbi:MAG: bifunctional diaminohydroxyphosphoribosylaminopyrimidine deaminase/5-amino-6-(5-phosphoribosylamino)uracil reductase RibD [Planctomycetales bacterium]|nr:bifunctional diaminohydroxyphosphoribosylaminopyrimidine deaminase/5-amino-6-(5-phosphoribosylamino)uracil reductase RibD [bacterium]UNM09068.1 MAG: bifunctional diaminohydroxyphosphoribosylaminopyrimidine deaminase/5-amino-6-(5-phosphoribosylamino)uracil reductase RibD [Planctomycetales bacterium]